MTSIRTAAPRFQPTPWEDEAVLLRRLRSGDEAAYEELVRHSGGMLLVLARRLVRNEETARDIVQEAFINAFKAVQTFRGESSLSTWLHRIVVNAALMRLRTAKRQPEVPIADLLPQFDDTGHHTTPVAPLGLGAEVLLLQKETRAKVRACIDRLPSAHRTVLMLRDIEELTTAETAAMLGITPNAVKIRLHRARQALTTLLLNAPETARRMSD